MEFKWSQKGNKVTMETEMGETHWIVPSDFKLEETSQDLLRLVEWLLYDNWGNLSEIEKRNAEYKGTRKFGKNIGLSFSCGCDSTAAMLVLPENTKIVHHERDEDLGGQLDLTNTHYMLNEMKKMGKEVLVVPSNHEKIRMYHSQPRGFASDWCPGAALVLLADYLDLGYIAYGTTLGESFIDRGYNWHDFYNHPSQIRWRKAFNHAGLHKILPVAALSEVAINKIVQNSPYKNLANSCLRSKIPGEGCKMCTKCWRKSMLNNWKMNEGYKTTPDMNHKLNPIYQAHTVIYCCQKPNAPWIPKEVKPFIHKDVKWVERYYPHSLKMVPEELRKGVIKKYEEYGIKPMTGPEIEELPEFSVIN
jgi:hypothetical protein